MKNVVNCHFRSATYLKCFTFNTYIENICVCINVEPRMIYAAKYFSIHSGIHFVEFKVFRKHNALLTHVA